MERSSDNVANCTPGVSKRHSLPAGGGEDTNDKSKHSITRPAKILAIAISNSLFVKLVVQSRGRTFQF
jgi:hypothetical protein